MSSRVFVVAGNPTHYYGAAAAFGELTRVGDHAACPFHTDELQRRIEADLFAGPAPITLDDWLLLGGHQVANAIACALIGHRFGRLRLLVYGAVRRDYTPRDVDLAQEQRGDGDGHRGSAGAGGAPARGEDRPAAAGRGG